MLIIKRSTFWALATQCPSGKVRNKKCWAKKYVYVYLCEWYTKHEIRACRLLHREHKASTGRYSRVHVGTNGHRGAFNFLHCCIALVFGLVFWGLLLALHGVIRFNPEIATHSPWQVHATLGSFYLPLKGPTKSPGVSTKSSRGPMKHSRDSTNFL